MRLCLVAAVVGSLAGCVIADPVPSLTGPDTDGSAVAFKLPLWPTQAKHDLASDRGHVVILDVWATWCEPCRDALPMWQDVAQHYAARGLKVYALNVDEDPRMVDAFMQETKLTLPVLLDSDARVAEALKVTMMPTTFFLDRKGVIRFRHDGFAEEQLQRYQSELEELLNEK